MNQIDYGDYRITALVRHMGHNRWMLEPKIYHKITYLGDFFTFLREFNVLVVHCNLKKIKKFIPKRS